jgi:hypothetical protein
VRIYMPNAIAVATVSGDVQVILSNRIFRELRGLIGEKPRGAVVNIGFPDGKVRVDAKVYLSDAGATKLVEVLESVTTKLAGQFVGEALENLQGASSQMAGVLTLFRGPIQKLLSVMRDLKVKVEPGAAAMNLLVDRRTLHAIILAGGVLSAGLDLLGEPAIPNESGGVRRERPIPKSLPAPQPSLEPAPKPSDVVTPSTKDGPEKP